MNVKVFVLAIVGALCAASTDAALQSVTGDLDGSCNGVNCATVGSTASQSPNQPQIFATDFNDMVGGLFGFLGNTATHAYRRRTQSKFVKFYVKCVGMASDATSTYSIAYTLDGGPSKSAGTGFTVTSNPYILIEGLTDGEHKLITTCTETVLGGTTITETDPVLLWWVVDTAGAQAVAFNSSPPTYDNQAHQNFKFNSSRKQDFWGTLTWKCRFSPQSTAWVDCGTAGAQTTTSTVTTNLLADGMYTFEVEAIYTPNTVGDVIYRSDLPVLKKQASASWTKDTLLPVLAVTSVPTVKSQWMTGKTAKFEFACKAGEVSCTYMCSFDGKNNDNYATHATTALPGFFPCTSPVSLGVKKTTTHSFRAYAVDAAGNPSTYSQLYMFYADGDTPKVEFDAVDVSEIGTAAQESPLKYYGTNAMVSTDNAAIPAIGQSLDGISSVTKATAALCGNACSAANALTAYDTVFQFVYNPTIPVYQLTTTKGAILANKKVNGKYYHNVLDSTNSDSGRMSYHCIHSEMFPQTA